MSSNNRTEFHTLTHLEREALNTGYGLRQFFNEQTFQRTMRRLRRLGLPKRIARSAAWHSAFPIKGLADERSR